MDARLLDLPQWVTWRYEKRDGKPTKVPYDPRNGKRASSTDPSTWCAHEVAREAEGYDGIGFVFSVDDPFCGVDLDHCVDHEKVHPDALKVVRDLGSFTEFSPSGTGVHVIIEATLNGWKRNRTADTPWEGVLEVYDHARFFTVTDRGLGIVEGPSGGMWRLPSEVHPAQEALDRIMGRFFPRELEPPQRPAASPVEDDAAIMERAYAARGGDKLRALMGGDTSGYGSASEADLALCDRLAFWLGGDPARIDRVFRSSGLYRPKWDREDYSRRTIEKALAGRTEFYSPPVSRARPDDPDTRTAEGKPQVNGPIGRPDGQPDTPRTTPALAGEEDILGLFGRAIGRAGLAGEGKSAQILYLCLTSRVLPWGSPTNRPVSAMPKGTTSSGKSYLLQAVLRFFPEESYVNLGSISRRYLLYMEDSLAHRFIVVPEWALVADDDELVAALRTLLSEGRLIHGTVEGEGKRKARRIEKEGPTGLLVTTTAAITDEELETRCFSFLTDDSPEQTRRVFEVLASLESGGPVVDFEPWHELQRWAATGGEQRVVIPYVRRLAELMPTVATRLRRDFVSLLCLIRAHAVLHRASRERDAEGRIVATLRDYDVVRSLIGGVVAEGVEASVSPAMRQTVQAVADELLASGREHISVKAVAARLEVGRSATYDRIRRALAGGWLVNLATKDERGLKLTVGADLPEGDEGFLPPVEELSGSRPDGGPDNEKGHLPAETEMLSGSPGRPDDPPDVQP